MSSLVLDVSDLRVGVRNGRAVSEIVRGVSFSLAEGETLGILGESGSGKSMTAEAVMGLLRQPLEILDGSIQLAGQELIGCTPKARRAVAGRDLAMIFQDSLSALNPSFSVGWQISEMFRVRAGLSRRAARGRTIDLLERVGIQSAGERYKNYPHQFSGGMRQRVMIAMALALSPKVLIADEPTTALDVTVQAQILDLLREMQEEMGMALIMITHDLGVVAQMADTVLVMYGGRVVERGPARSITGAARHPYTLGLLNAAPGLNMDLDRLTPIPGVPPEALSPPSGCAFHPRCGFATELCSVEVPRETLVDVGQIAACHHLDQTQRDRESVVSQ